MPLVLGLAVPAAVAAQRSTGDPRDTAVVMVRGYAGAGKCPGTDITKAYWGDVYLKLRARGWTGRLLPVSFYRCDFDGVDITGYGPKVPAGAKPVITEERPRAGFRRSAGIRRIAHDLAWFVYDTFAVRRRPVDLVGFSMGGLLIRYALDRVMAGDPAFPPTLIVPRAVTIATPHAGLDPDTVAETCGSTRQCVQMAADSPLMTRLNTSGLDPQAAGGTDWSLAGSRGGCDIVPAASALAMPLARRVAYVHPCYEHGEYLWDYSGARDATIRMRAPGERTAAIRTQAPHVLAWLAGRLVARH